MQTGLCPWLWHSSKVSWPLRTGQTDRPKVGKKETQRNKYLLSLSPLLTKRSPYSSPWWSLTASPGSKASGTNCLSQQSCVSIAEQWPPPQRTTPTQSEAASFLCSFKCDRSKITHLHYDPPPISSFVSPSERLWGRLTGWQDATWLECVFVFSTTIFSPATRCHESAAGRPFHQLWAPHAARDKVRQADRLGGSGRRWR